MSKFMFRLDKVTCTFQRGKREDEDIITFGVTIGGKDRGHLGGHFTAIATGTEIPLAKFPPDKPPSKWNNWEVGPIEAADDDAVRIAYAGVNISDSDQALSDGDIAKIAFATWGAVGGVAIAVAGDVNPIVGAVFAGISAVFGEVFGDLDKQPKCDGVVFADSLQFSGSELARAVADADGTLQLQNHYTDENGGHPKECGHEAETEVTVMVRKVQFESLKQFLGSKFDLTQGLRKIPGVGTAGASIRSLIES